MSSDRERTTSHLLLTQEPQRLGSGWLSGTIGAIVGLAGLAAAACLVWPQALTTPALRDHYPANLRTWVVAALAVATALATLSLWLRRKKTLGVVALGSAALGGTLLLFAADLSTPGTTTSLLAVDVFTLNLLLYPAVFLPLERLWPHRDQPTFRAEWWTDLAWFASSALLVQLTTFLVLAPGNAVSGVTASFGANVAALRFVVQFAAIVVVADVAQYWVHRACHQVPFLWRFHAIHHSAEAMDWLAGSRLHVVDALLTRALVFLAIAALGFHLHVIGLYLVFIAAQATFVHANVAWRLRWLEGWLVTPRFHHWHHAKAPIDVNFAVHLPWLDRLFGTFHLPPLAWPEHYGLAAGAKGPRGFWRQLVAPFRRRQPPWS